MMEEDELETFDRERYAKWQYRSMCAHPPASAVSLILSAFAFLFALISVVINVRHADVHVQSSSQRHDRLVTGARSLETSLSHLQTEVARLHRLLEGTHEKGYNDTVLHAVMDEVDRLAANARLPATCEGYRARGGLSAGEGRLLDIDPDGFAVGDAPIEVTCRAGSGGEVYETEVTHDGGVSQSTPVQPCGEEDCFETGFVYSKASMKQLAALIDESKSCRQQITFDCYNAPLSHFGSWVDRTGEAQTYFYGENHGRRVCACSRDSTCRSSPTPTHCECDARPFDGQWHQDTGFITNSSALPITAFRYGFLHGSANITVGPLICQGQRQVKGEPGSSCAALKLAGHTVSGYQLLRKADRTFYVAYCDFSRAFSDPNLEQSMGKVVVEDSPKNAIVAAEEARGNASEDDVTHSGVGHLQTTFLGVGVILLGTRIAP